jgi:hypothetical protein
MYRRIGCKLLIAGVTAMLGAAPASACDGCACGAGYGYYAYGPSWGYSNAYYVAPAYNPAPVVAVVPAPRVYYSAPVYGYAAPALGAYYAPAYGYGYYRSAGYGWRGRW